MSKFIDLLWLLMSRMFCRLKLIVWGVLHAHCFKSRSESHSRCTRWDVSFFSSVQALDKPTNWFLIMEVFKCKGSFTFRTAVSWWSKYFWGFMSSQKAWDLSDNMPALFCTVNHLPASQEYHTHTHSPFSFFSSESLFSDARVLLGVERIWFRENKQIPVDLIVWVQQQTPEYKRREIRTLVTVRALKMSQCSSLTRLWTFG